MIIYMNRKGFASLLLVVIVAVLAGAAGYFLIAGKLGQQPESSSQTQTTPPVQTQPVMNDTLSPEAESPVALPPVPPLPTTCKDEQEGTPAITFLSSRSGPIGTKLEIKGCNFSGFEGDKTAWIENNQGVKGILYGEIGSTSNLLKVTLKSPLCQKDTSYSGLPCDAQLELTPGAYKIYTMPWGKKSNEAIFTIR